MKFNDDTKEVREFNADRFNYGVHKVQLAFFNLDKTEGGKEFVEIGVVDPADAERNDTTRVWFTTPKAANYSFNVLRSLYVHNAPEAKKDEARATVDAVQDTEELVAKLNEKLVGGEAWFSIYPSPDRTYQNQAGETKPSIDKNVYAYQPKERPELLPPKSGVDQFIDAAKRVMPGTEEVPFESEGDAPSKAANTIPKNW